VSPDWHPRSHHLPGKHRRFSEEEIVNLRDDFKIDLSPPPPLRPPP